MSCSFGAAPATFAATPAATALAGGPQAGTVADIVPFLNIPAFGMCSSLANPTVAAATAAALGALTPMPCIPATVAPWVPGSMQTQIQNMPALHDGCSLSCMWGGMISISFAGQATVAVS